MRRLRPRRPEREARSPALARLRRLRLSLTAAVHRGAGGRARGARGARPAQGLRSAARLAGRDDGQAGDRLLAADLLLEPRPAAARRPARRRPHRRHPGGPRLRRHRRRGRGRSSPAAAPSCRSPTRSWPRSPTARSAAEDAGRRDRRPTRAGDRVRLLAGPFYRDPEGDAAGAVVSAAALGPTESAHDELVLTIVLACAGLLVLAAGAGYLLAGRSLRPALRGLAQQEALLADAAHELRTPIASIRATLEAAQLDPSTAAGGDRGGAGDQRPDGRHARRAARLGAAGSRHRAAAPDRAAPRPAGRGRRRRGRAGRRDRGLGLAQPSSAATRR